MKLFFTLLQAWAVTGRVMFFCIVWAPSMKVEGFLFLITYRLFRQLFSEQLHYEVQVLSAAQINFNANLSIMQFCTGTGKKKTFSKRRMEIFK